ncbi:MAG: NAD(P)/FAD-dependent oxidoreductase [Haliangium ochraceum]
MADLVVAGGGPAGSSLAILAGRAGFSVDLFDAARFPREKPCGEGLMPAGVGALTRLGLADTAGGQPFAGVRYHGFGVTTEATFPAPLSAPQDGGPAVHGLGQRRTVLDAACLTAARATPGVRVFEGATVEGVVRRAGRAVALRVDGATVPGALIVGADGALSAVRKGLELDGPPARRPRLGVRMHFRLAADLDPPRFVEIFVGGGHELYLTPLPDRQVLVAGLTERGPTGDDALGALRTWIATHPALAERLRGAEPISGPRGRFPLAHRALAGVAPGAVLLGDAAGFTDPITGGGMAQAFLSAELLARHLPRILRHGDTEWLWRFDRRRRALLRDYVLLTKLILAAARRPTWARWTLHAMRAQPRVMRHLVGVAGGLRRLT